MNEEFQFKNWGYKDLGMLGAYIVEKNNESYKQIDVTNVKQYIKDLIEENQQLKEKLQQKEDVINKAKVDLEKHLNAKSYGNHKYELFSREYLEDLLEILDNKGE